MNYYQHHIGDFIKATARLSDTQAMTYLRLIWVYYDSEAPLPDDLDALAFQVGGTQDDIALILKTFFRLQDDGWHQLRCDREILDYHAMIEKRKKAGLASGEKRRSKTYKEHKLNTCSADVNACSFLKRCLLLVFSSGFPWLFLFQPWFQGASKAHP